MPAGEDSGSADGIGQESLSFGNNDEQGPGDSVGTHGLRDAVEADRDERDKTAASPAAAGKYLRSD